MQTTQAHSGEWRGRFPYNEIISLLDVNRTFNLESTSQDLTVGELLDLTGVDAVRDEARLQPVGGCRRAARCDCRFLRGARRADRDDARHRARAVSAGL